MPHPPARLVPHAAFLARREAPWPWLAWLGLALLAALLTGVFAEAPWWVPLSWLGGGGLLLACGLWPRFGMLLTAGTVFIGTPSLFVYVEQIIVRAPLCLAFALPSALGVCARSVARRESLASGSPLMPPLLILLGLHALALFWAPRVWFGLANVLTLLANLLIFWLIVHGARTVEDLRRLVVVLLGSAWVCAAGVVASQDWAPDYTWFVTRRWGLGFNFFVDRPGGLGFCNQVAAYLLVTGCLAAGLWPLARRTGRRAHRIALALSYVALLCAMVLTKSRGGFIGLFAGVLGVLAMHPALRGQWLRRTGAFALLLLTCVLLARPGFIDRMLVGFGYSGDLIFGAKPSSTGEGEVSGMDARFDMWADALGVMEADPALLLAGLGPGGFLVHTDMPEVHSLWLAFYFDLGLPGLLLLGWIVFLLARRFRRALTAPMPPPLDQTLSPLLWGLAAAILGELAFHSLIDHDLTSTVSRYAFLYLALAGAGLKVADAARATATKDPPSR